MTLALSPGLVLRFFGTCTLLLATAGAAVKVARYQFGREWLFGLAPLLDLDQEGNLPSLYSAFGLACAAGLFWLTSRVVREAGGGWVRHWQGLAVVFAYLTLDEGSRIHEIVSSPLQRTLGTGGVLYYAWVIPAGALALALLALYVRFWLALPARTRWLCAGATLLFLGGALGMELVEGRWAEAYGHDNATFAAMTTLEELLEMSGIAVLIYALVGHLAHLGAEVRLGFQGQPVSRPARACRPLGSPSLGADEALPLVRRRSGNS